MCCLQFYRSELVAIAYPRTYAPICPARFNCYTCLYKFSHRYFSSEQVSFLALGYYFSYYTLLSLLCHALVIEELWVYVGETDNRHRGTRRSSLLTSMFKSSLAEKTANSLLLRCW